MAETPDDKNIVSLADARKRQKTVRVDPSGRRSDQRKGKLNGASKGTGPSGNKIWLYVQLIAFLAVTAYFMQLCSGRL